MGSKVVRVVKKRKRRCCVNTALLDIFYDAQDLLQEGNAAKALKLLRRCVKVAAAAAEKPAMFRDPRNPEEPPVHVILSGVHNAMGEVALDGVLEASGQRKMAGESLATAEACFTKAVALNEANAAAWLSLAGIRRDAHDLEAAAACYSSAAKAAPQEQVDAGEGWVDAWVVEPHASCRPIALYHLALLAAQGGKHSEAERLLPELGVKYMIAEEVWAAARRGAAPAARRPKRPTPVALKAGLIPAWLQQRLVTSFTPESTYWAETGYSGRGYFSWYYDPAAAASNIVEALIAEVIKNSGLAEGAVKATEWWVHTRLPGRDVGHQLHFDTEEKTLEETGELIFPLRSVVVYLTGCRTGGMTMVLNQTVGETDADVAGWGAHPQDGAVLYFPGHLLHGVLPACSGAVSDGKTQRLTLMIALWGTRDFSPAKPDAVGPQGRVPKEATWAKDIALTASDLKAQKVAAAAPGGKALRVESFGKMWHEVQGAGEAKYVVPKSIDQRFFMPHLDFEQVLRKDHCRWVDEEEEEEEEEQEDE